MGANYDRGIICYQTKQYKQAEKEFRQELIKAPDSAAAHAMLGMTLVALRKGDQGHKEALEAVRLFPDYAYGHYTLSYTFAAINKPKESEKAIVEALRIHPDEAYLFARAAQIYINQKKWARALEMADTGLECEPEHEECLINRAAALIELNRLTEAEETLQQVLQIDPENHSAHLNMGATQLRLFKHAEAFTHYREALRLNPNSEQARLGVIESLKAKNPLYHGLLRFSVFCRSLPPVLVALALLLCIIPVTRVIIVAIFGAYAIANYLFEIALHLDPVGKDFVAERKAKTVQTLKELTWPFCMIVFGLMLAIGAALAPTSDKHYHHRHKAPVKDEPVDSLKFDDYQTYMTYVQTRIKRHWQPPHLHKSSSTGVQFTVNQSGSVSNIRILQSSGDLGVDNAALAALKEASPFPKLPPKGEKSVEIEFHFDYHDSDDASKKPTEGKQDPQKDSKQDSKQDPKQDPKKDPKLAN
ncbi:MAG TPA: TonB family protein [Drouetiella sp.]|jgi:TonB family protein